MWYYRPSSLWSGYSSQSIIREISSSQFPNIGFVGYTGAEVTGLAALHSFYTGSIVGFMRWLL